MSAAIYVDVKPELLEWAAQRAGWDVDTARGSEPNFQDWLSGVKQPTLVQLQNFATRTHAPFGMLLLSEVPKEEIPIPDMRTLNNEYLDSPSGDLLDTIYICQSRQNWYRDYAEDNGFERLPFISTATVQTPPEEAARQVRGLLAFDNRTPNKFQQDKKLSSLVHIVEDLGVLVMRNSVVGSSNNRRLKVEEFRGFSLCDPLAPLIFLNSSDTTNGQVFTLIHEFAHLLLGHSALSDAKILPLDGNPEEAWCNQVAAHTLMPLPDLLETYSGVFSVQECERVAKHFGVSTLVVIKGLYEAKTMTWDEYRARYEDESERITRLLAQKKRQDQEKLGGGSYYNTQLSRLGSIFTDAVIASTSQGGTAFRDAYRLLGVKKHSTFLRLGEELRSRGIV